MSTTTMMAIILIMPHCHRYLLILFAFPLPMASCLRYFRIEILLVRHQQVKAKQVTCLLCRIDQSETHLWKWVLISSAVVSGHACGSRSNQSFTSIYCHVQGPQICVQLNMLSTIMMQEALEKKAGLVQDNGAPRPVQHPKSHDVGCSFSWM